MKRKKHWVQWLAGIGMYSMTAYISANGVGYIFYLIDFLKQTDGVLHIISSLYASFIASFMFNQFWNVDIVVVVSSGAIWSLLIYRNYSLDLQCLVIIIWSLFMVSYLYLVYILRDLF